VARTPSDASVPGVAGRSSCGWAGGFGCDDVTCGEAAGGGPDAPRCFRPGGREAVLGRVLREVGPGDVIRLLVVARTPSWYSPGSSPRPGPPLAVPPDSPSRPTNCGPCAGSLEPTQTSDRREARHGGRRDERTATAGCALAGAGVVDRRAGGRVAVRGEARGRAAGPGRGLPAGECGLDAGRQDPGAAARGRGHADGRRLPPGRRADGGRQGDRRRADRADRGRAPAHRRAAGRPVRGRDHPDVPRRQHRARHRREGPRPARRRRAGHRSVLATGSASRSAGKGPSPPTPPRSTTRSADRCSTPPPRWSPCC
jgi:hypothetical protein